MTHTFSRQVPATAASAACFSPIIPEPQLTSRFAGAVQSPGKVELNMPERAVLTARSAAKARWGLITLADVLRAIPAAGSIPAARKLNNLGIGLYGDWRRRQYDGKFTEWIMTPVPDQPELKREWTIRWYSPEKGGEQEITYLPPIFEKDFFGDIVAYSQNKGVEVVPYVNSLGHNTLIPRLISEFAAKNEAEEPQEFGYCPSNPNLIAFVTGWYQHIYEKYLKSSGVHTLHIQMNEVGRNFCRCPECSKVPMEQLLKDYAVTIIKHLMSVGCRMWSFTTTSSPVTSGKTRLIRRSYSDCAMRGGRSHHHRLVGV
jgi:hypothetical protein